MDKERKEMELLLWLDAIEEFVCKNPDSLPPGGVGEILISNGIYDVDDYNEILEILLDKGYIKEDGSVTAKGRLLVNDAKNGYAKKNNITNNLSVNFSLINISGGSSLSDVKKTIVKVLDVFYKRR